MGDRSPGLMVGPWVGVVVSGSLVFRHKYIIFSYNLQHVSIKVPVYSPNNIEIQTFIPRNRKSNLDSYLTQSNKLEIIFGQLGP